VTAIAYIEINAAGLDPGQTSPTTTGPQMSSFSVAKIDQVADLQAPANPMIPNPPLP
jgi:hypothetical protein